jgi:hypothetical protein
MLKIAVRMNMVKPPPGKKVEVDLTQDTFLTFLNKCSQTMGVNAKKVFDIHGMQITKLAELVNQDAYYVSEVIL